MNNFSDLELQAPKNDSHILDTFQGELYIEMVGYQGGWMQKAYENFTALSLPFPDADDEEFELNDGLNEFLILYEPKLEKNQFFCDRCWQQTPYVKSVYFNKLPKVLVMRLDRFGKDYPERRNNLSPVNFNQKLDLYDYIYKVSYYFHMKNLGKPQLLQKF